MEVGLVKKIDIDTEMQQAYLDYAMSVIIARALPDARDGLKPVHRRILYAMHSMGLRPDTPFKKSARIVGEVLGKYHPHGDAAVYEAMVRMAQEFSMRYPLIEGQGNFGSMDGDSAAAMRYTEARLAPATEAVLTDIQKDTVEFERNFDDSLDEPLVLPSALPNLLINGATGIAVGMSTNIPPHNLSEVVDALILLLDRWERQDSISLDDLMSIIKGPDFPTGGVIIQDSEDDGLVNAYARGRGRVTVQAKARIEEMSRGRERVIVSALPYMTNKASLIERIAKLVRDEEIEGISDLRDESDREGMRIVIELTKNADAESVIQNLYQRTPMRTTFGIILLALVDGEPRMLSLKQALRVFLEHRLVVVRRRSEYDLTHARQRAHVLEGIRTALDHLDEVISLIRESRDVDSARNKLRSRFKLSQEQAQAILDLPLRRLAALERRKIETEHREVLATIRNLESLLRSPKKMRQAIADELLEIKQRYGDGRLTQIVKLGEGETQAAVLTSGHMAPDKTVWVAATPEGLISRTSGDKLPRLSGRVAPAFLLQANTRDTLYCVDDQGNCAALAVHVLPETDSIQDGAQVARISSLSSEHPLAAIFCLPEKGHLADGWFVLTTSRQGMMKKSPLEELPGPSAHSFQLAKINDGDSLGWVRLTDGSQELLLATASGMAIRFSEAEIRPMGLVAAGVMGLKLKDKDEIVGIDILPSNGEVYLQRTDGVAKRVPAADFPRQGRYGQGVIAWKLARQEKLVGLAVGKGTARVTLFLKRLSPKTVRMDSAPLRTRPAGGSVVMALKSGEQVTKIVSAWAPPRPVVIKKPAKQKKRAKQ
ncbi:MAG TPA: DNA topoisomerase (ATP-hydrolyzing) [Anaerolineales bacterium]|nr:DNA topoisomerase (ATP-hydrolyzing) [Anaerolineales bacterium]